MGAIVALVAMVAFLPSLDNGFVDWDDEDNFVNNPGFQGLGWNNIVWAWKTVLVGVYQPLAWMLLEAQYALWGLDPRGYHAASLAMHALTAVLLYVLIVTLLGRAETGRTPRSPRTVVTAAAVSAALFAVHPLRVETVAWVSAQPYLPCAIFGLLTVLAYLRAIPARPGGGTLHRGWLTASLMLFAGALLSKAIAVGLPLVLVALDIYPLRRVPGAPMAWLRAPARGVILEKLPYLALSCAFALLALAAKTDASTLAGVAAPKAAINPAQLVQSCQAIAFYIVKTVFPTQIGPLYAAPRYVDIASPAVFLSVIFVLGVTALAWWRRQRWPGLAVAWVSYLVLLGPTIGVLRYITQLAAPRYAYIPIMSFHVVLAWLLWRGASLAASRTTTRARGAQAAALVLAVVSMVVLGAQSWAFTRAWKDGDALWTWADMHGGHDVADVQNYLGLAKMRQGKMDEAAPRFEAALRLRPDGADAYANQAVMFAYRGEYAAAEAGFRKALSLNPMHPQARRHLALALQIRGRVNEAVGEFAEVLRRDQRNPNNFNQLYKAVLERGVDPGVAAAAQAVLRAPSDAAAYKAVQEAVARVSTR